MKKSTMWIIIAVVVVVIAGVFFYMHNKNSEPSPSEEAPQSEEVKPSEEAKPEEKPSEEAKPEEKPSEEVKEEAKIDYSAADITEWMKSEGDTDEAAAKLINIDMVQYGTAGASLKMAAAGCDMLDLSNMENAADSAKAYLSGMTEIQKDFFSFQWENVYNSASSTLADPENAKELLADAGVENFDASSYTKEKLDSLNESVRSLLDEMGVTNQWKNFTDIEPFNMAK